MFEFLTSFLDKVAGRLSGIARATKSGLNARDLHGDVCIAANEISEKRGYPIDLQDPADGELILSRVHSQTRKQRDWRLHYAVRIDAEIEGNIPWSERIPEAVTTDPVSVLEDRESSIGDDDGLTVSYSQAAAYVVTFANFDDDRPRVSEYLVISPGLLERRFDRALYTVALQDSLFDGHEIIDSDFTPLAGRYRAPIAVVHLEMGQVELQF